MREQITPGETETEKVTTYIDADGKKVMESERSSAKTPGYNGPGAEKFSPGAISSNLSGAAVGKTSFKGFKMSQIGGLYWIGAMLIIAGLAAGYFLTWTLGALCAGSGLALIMIAATIENYPWLLLIPALVLLVAIGYVCYMLVKGKSFQTALGTIIPAIENAGVSGKAVKATITATAKADGTVNTVKAVVAETKRNPTISAKIEAAKIAKAKEPPF